MSSTLMKNMLLKYLKNKEKGQSFVLGMPFFFIFRCADQARQTAFLLQACTL